MKIRISDTALMILVIIGLAILIAMFSYRNEKLQNKVNSLIEKQDTLCNHAYEVGKAVGSIPLWQEKADWKERLTKIDSLAKTFYNDTTLSLLEKKRRAGNASMQIWYKNK